jgi:hypothetical protein
MCRIKIMTLLITGMCVLSLELTSASAQQLDRSTPEASDRFQLGAVAEEKREERELVECNRRADLRNPNQTDRFAFILRCLGEQEARVKPHG